MAGWARYFSVRSARPQDPLSHRGQANPHAPDDCGWLWESQFSYVIPLNKDNARLHKRLRVAMR